MLIAGRRLSRMWVRLFGWSGSVLLVSSLCFSLRAYKWGPERNRLNMTVLAIGAALTIVAAAQSGWKAPKLLRPVQVLGQRSYETYLTHMFAVLGVFAIFVHVGKPLGGVPVLFATTILCAGLLGWLAAVFFTEPMNRFLRRRFKAGESALGAALPKVD